MVFLRDTKHRRPRMADSIAATVDRIKRDPSSVLNRTRIHDLCEELGHAWRGSSKGVGSSKGIGPHFQTMRLDPFRPLTPFVRYSAAPWRRARETLRRVWPKGGNAKGTRSLPP